MFSASVPIQALVCMKLISDFINFLKTAYLTKIWYITENVKLIKICNISFEVFGWVLFKKYEKK
jgi:hypothetical protein